MPEVGEVAHVVAQLRRNILNFKISKLTLNNDPLLFPVLKGVSDPEDYLSKLQPQLQDSSITSVGRHGKYFWLRLQKQSRSDILLMHFGMTGMIHMKGIKSHLTFMEGGGDKKFIDPKTGKRLKKEDLEEIEEKEETWPPKFSKFVMTLSSDDQDIELSFVDPRRLGRVRFLDGNELKTDVDLMNVEPLSLLGPDYSKSTSEDNDKFVIGDPDPNDHGRSRLSVTDFQKLVLSKNKPIKPLLLDQAFFAGIGNWVSDEICYQARIHPEQNLKNIIDAPKDGSIDPTIQRLYDSIISVVTLSVQVEGDVTEFPDNWIMLYRWGKARKNTEVVTSDGYKVDHITVGGRTSCIVPELQKLEGGVAPKKAGGAKKKVKKEIKEEDDDNIKSEESEEEYKPRKRRAVSTKKKSAEK